MHYTSLRLLVGMWAAILAASLAGLTCPAAYADGGKSCAACFAGAGPESVPVSPRQPAQSVSSDPELLNMRTANASRVAARAGASAPAPLGNRGLIDGVYACDVTVGGKSERSVITFNGHADGSTIYIVAAMRTHYIDTNASQAFRGFGVGQLSATGFAGTTWDGQSFNFRALGLEESHQQGTYDVLRLAGQVGIAPNLTAQMNCKNDRALY